MASSVSVANKNKADIGDGNEYKIRKWLVLKFHALRHLLFLSCSYHGVTDRICKQKSRLKCARFLYKMHVTLQCIVVSALKKPSKVNTILKVVIFKHSVIFIGFRAIIDFQI
jgi:hypothetical protein